MDVMVCLPEGIPCLPAAARPRVVRSGRPRNGWSEGFAPRPRHGNAMAIHMGSGQNIWVNLSGFNKHLD